MCQPLRWATCSQERSDGILPPLAFGAYGPQPRTKVSDEIQHGQHSYRCYEFQIIATADLALVLMLDQTLCQSIVVEPESDEDVEAKLDVDPERAGAAVTPQAGPLSLVIQIKHRGTPWTQAPFVEVLQGKSKKATGAGPVRRIRPLERLAKDPALRFVLLTDAQLNEQVKDFAIDTLGADSKATALPDGIDPLPPNPAELAKRIGARTGEKVELLLLRIARVLRERGNVPEGRIEGCTKAMKEAVRSRLLGEAGSQALTLEQVWDIVDAHGGVRPITRDVAFVPPANFAKLMDRLESRHALVLTGMTGTGKTEAAEEIVYRLRTGSDKYDLVRASDGIDAVREKLRAPGRHVFYLSDPWGSHAVSEDAKAWRSAVPQFLRHSSPTKKFVVTSRAGVMDDALGAKGTEDLARWTVSLSAADYPLPLRERILNASLVGCSPAQLAFAKENSAEILAGIETPQSLVDFARELRQAAAPRKEDLRPMIQGSVAAAVSERLYQELRERAQGEVGGAVLLWAMLIARADLTDANVAEWRDAAKAGSYTHELEPRKVIRWLNASGWVFVRSGTYVIHPTRVEALEALVGDEPELAGDLLSSVLSGLAERGRPELVTALIRTCRARRVQVPGAAAEAAEKFLRERWSASGRYGAEEALADLAELSTQEDVTRKLAQILTARDHAGRKRLGSSWRRPSLSKLEQESLRSSPETCRFAEHFVRRVLPTESFDEPYDPADVAEFFASLGCDLDAAFVDAAEAAIQMGGSTATLTRYALRNADAPFDRLIGAALDEIDAVRGTSVDWEQARREEQGEVDAAIGPDEAPATLVAAWEALEAAVEARRRHHSSSWLLDHPRIYDLLEPWSKAIEKGDSMEEVHAIAARCPQDDRRPAWAAAARAGRHELLPLLVADLREAPERFLEDCVESSVRLVDSPTWVATLAPLMADLTLSRKALVHSSLRALKNHSEVAELEERLSVLSAPERTAFAACEAVDASNRVKGATAEPTHNLMEGAVDVLQQLVTAAGGDLRRRAAQVLHQGGKLDPHALAGLLADPDPHVREWAIARAGPINRPAVQRALVSDPDFRPRRAAIQALAPDATDSERGDILAQERHPSAYVRLAVATVIGEQRWHDGQDTLVRLLSDARDFNDHTNYSGRDYRVAWEAARALARLDIQPPTLRAVEAFVRSGVHASRDVDVHEALISLVARSADTESMRLLEAIMDGNGPSGLPSGYVPLRAAAARAIALMLQQHPEMRSNVAHAPLVAACQSLQGELAAPALVALGIAGPSVADLAAIRDVPTFAANRDILLRAGWQLGGNGGARYPGGPPKDPSHPGMRLLEHASAMPDGSEDDWRRWLDTEPAVRQWLEGLAGDLDVAPGLQSVFDAITAGALARRDHSSSD